MFQARRQVQREPYCHGRERLCHEHHCLGFIVIPRRSASIPRIGRNIWAIYVAVVRGAKSLNSE